MKPDLPHVLVVEPGDQPPRWVSALRGDGFAVSWVGNGPAALERIAEAPVDAVVTRLRGKRVDGRALLGRLRQGSSPACVIVLARPLDPDQVARLIDEGAEHVLEGPVRVPVLRAVLRRGLAHAARARRLDELELAMDRRYRDDPLTGASAAVRRVVDQIHHVAPTRAMVLIEGERGTGKSRVAQAIHRDSPRRDGPFERVSLAALEESRMDSELFGGAGEAPGRFDVADGGTLFLEDVDRAPPPLQIRLLAAIRGRGAGSGPERRRDVRLLASTEQDLAARVRAGRFREDLLERLGAVRITLPPLRERPETSRSSSSASCASSTARIPAGSEASRAARSKRSALTRGPATSTSCGTRWRRWSSPRTAAGGSISPISRPRSGASTARPRATGSSRG